MTVNGLEQMKNSGKEKIIDLVSARVKNAERTMANNMSVGVYSDGTGSAGKQLGGLQLLVSDTGLGTVGGISATTWSFWQNYTYDFSTNGITPSATTIQVAMNTVYLNTMRNRDMVDLIVADNTYYQYYWNSLQAIQRFGSDDGSAAAGFKSLKFMGADVVADGGVGGDAPSSHMYFLNTDYLFFRPHRDRNMIMLPEKRSVNQDAVVKNILWGGNMTVSNRQLQGVIVA